MREQFTKEQRQAAVKKFRTAAKDMEKAKNSKEWHEASDRFIDAQYEGLPRRYLLPMWPH